MKTNNYLLKSHRILYARLLKLKLKIRELNSRMPLEEYRKHPLVKLFGRIKEACFVTIPQNPNLPDYYLKGELAKFRRFKRGLQRNRLLFCFSNTPPIIVYLYINDEKHQRKEGSKSDPYKEFTDLVRERIVSSDPNDFDLLMT